MSSYLKVVTSRNFGLVYWSHFFAAVADKLLALLIVAMGVQFLSVEFANGNILTQVFFLLPFLLLGPLFGVWVDQGNKRRIMMLSSAARMLIALVFIGLYLSAGLDPRLKYAVYGLLFTLGTMTALFSPAKSAVVPEVIGKQDHLTAYALIATVGPIATILATPLAGIILGKNEAKDALTHTRSAYWLLGVSAAIYLATVCALFFVKTLHAGAQKTPRRRMGYFVELYRGIRFIARRPALQFFMINNYVFWAFSAFFMSYIGAYCKEQRGDDIKALGYLLFSLGVGMISGNLIAGKITRWLEEFLKYPVVLCITALLLGAFSFQHDYATAFFWIVPIGFAGGFFMAPIENDLNRHTARSFRGRVFTVSNLSLGVFVLFLLAYYWLRATFANVPDRDRLILRAFAGLCTAYSLGAFFWTARILRRGAFATLWIFLYRVCWVAARCWFGLYNRLEVVGAEKIPHDRAFVAAFNHASFLDGPLGGVVFWPRIRFIMSDDYYKRGFRWLMDGLGLIILPEEGAKVGTIREAVRALRGGCPVGIFPEGAISRDGRLDEAAAGVGAIVLKGRVPVYPIALIGAFEALPRHALFPKPKKITAVIGDPLDFEDDTHDRAHVADEVMRAVGRLIEKHAPRRKT